MGLLDFLSKPMDPEQGNGNEYDIFLAERGVKKQSWDYNYRDAYEYFRETGVDPYDEKSKHWVSKFKHRLSPVSGPKGLAKKSNNPITIQAPFHIFLKFFLYLLA